MYRPHHRDQVTTHLPHQGETLCIDSSPQLFVFLGLKTFPARNTIDNANPGDRPGLATKDLERLELSNHKL